MTEKTDSFVRDLARAMFAIDSTSESEQDRKAEWQGKGHDYVVSARKALRSLEGQGYALTESN